MEGWMEGKHGKGGMSPRKEGEHPPKVRGEFYGVKSVVRSRPHQCGLDTRDTQPVLSTPPIWQVGENHASPAPVINATDAGH